ncbi:NUDIX domain-containing protein [Candidatus Uhrbacteria bacterium]|nr:NUDIX domain-containing protein [Candidatus Uhrbacteria bacterium]
MSEDKRPKIGVGVIIVHNGKVLIGERTGAHGSSTWAPPGGHLEWLESPEECATREAREETGIEICNVRPIGFTNDIMTEDDKHYVTLFMRADLLAGEPKVMEPNRCLGWNWISWEDLPRPLFIPVENLILQGYHPLKAHNELVS